MVDFLSIIFIVAGLCLFEIISSIDNSIINAQVLSTMEKRARRWFLVWGMIFAVFVVRGLLPWIIVWASIPSLGPIGALTATFSNNPAVLHAVEMSSPILLMGGGVFLLLLFLHWLFLEEKKFGSREEVLLKDRVIAFFVVALIILALVFWFTLKTDPHVTMGALIGAIVFFITNGLKQNAGRHKKDLVKKNISDLSKILYLEILDSTFSIDGVLGAFAFTLSVPLILIGNGLGAFVVRQFTVRKAETIKKYIFLRRGAMYSILFLGLVMIADGFGYKAPIWLSPLATFIIVGYFFWKSHRHVKRQKRLKKEKGKSKTKK
jgi:uncharacterized protein